jgi:uncharacterized membrane protein YczE
MKYIFYVIGISLLTLVFSCTIQFDLETPPFDSVLVGMSMNLGLTVGIWEILLALFLIGCNSILKRRRPEVFGLELY